MTRANLVFRLVASATFAIFLTGCSSPEVRKARHKEAGDKLLAEQKYSDAILEYRNALKIDARYGEARFGLAGAFEGADRRREAAREYIRAAELLPQDADVQFKAATLFLSARDFENARKHADAVLKLEPGRSDAHVVRANSLAGLKDLPAAIKEIEEAIQLSPLDSKTYSNLGALRLAEGNREQAEAAYRKAVEIDPRSVPARVAFGLFHWSTGNTARAEAELKEAVAIDEKDLLANRSLAAFYMSGNRPAEAEGPLLRLVGVNDTQAMIVVANHYRRTGRGGEARPIFERLLADKQARTTALVSLAEIDHAAGKRDAAYSRIGDELSSQPTNAALLTTKASLLHRDGRLPEAEEAADKAVLADADSAQAHFARGVIKAALRKGDEAIASFTNTIRINPRAAAADVHLATLMLARGKPDDALRHAEAARKNAPTALPARLSVASALVAKGDRAKAMAELKSLVVDYPETSAVHALQGDLLATQRDETGAQRAYERALAIQAGNVQALNGLVGLDVRLKRFESARDRLARALTAQPANAQVLAMAGRLETAAGNLPEAERQFRAAIEADPAALEVYAMLAGLYMRQQKLDQARGEFAQVAKRAPNPVAAKTMVGVIYEMQNRPDEAMKVYEEILAGTKLAPVAANNLAWRYAQRGEKLDLALELAQGAKAQLPDNADVDDTLGWVYYKKNMPELAVGTLEKSAKRDPQNASYQVRLGLAYAKAGRKAEAIRALEQALQLRSDLPEADEARRTLMALKG